MALVAAQPATPPPADVATVFRTLCENCHGATLAGGQAPSLLDDEGLHGDSDADLARTIREGALTTAMPSFKGALTDQQIRALVIYIREGRARASQGTMPAPPTLPARIESERHAFRVELVADDLETPWGLEIMPDGKLLVTERPGRLRVVDGDRLLPPITGVPAVWEKQDGGLLDVGLHPDFQRNGWVYLALSEAGGAAPGDSTTRIVRGRLHDGALVDQVSIFQATPALYWASNTHYGARLLFDRQGLLYFSIGDRGRPAESQDLGSPYGKLHRVRDDGSVPADNPFVGRTGAVASVWSYGHRNQQGLAIDSQTGALWATEHGPRGGDELNLVVKGRDYGWPTITYGMNDNGTPITDRTERDGLEQPVVYWTPSLAVGAIAFYTGDLFPRWKQHLLVTALAGQQLRRLELDAGRVTNQEVLLRGYGRVRDVAVSADGPIYLALNNPGRIVRLVPER